MKKWRAYPVGESVGMTREELAAIPDLSSDSELISILKAGDTARVAVARIGNKVLYVLLKPSDSGFEVSSEWNVFSANSLRFERKLSAGSVFVEPLR